MFIITKIGPEWEMLIHFEKCLLNKGTFRVSIMRFVINAKEVLESIIDSGLPFPLLP